MEKVKTIILKVGDVIKSEKFAFGRYALGYEFNKFKDNKYDPKSCKVDRKKIIVDLQERRNISLQRIPNGRKRNISTYESERGKALFVVEESDFKDCPQRGDMFINYDEQSDTWHILARRLNPSGSYNPDGELIYFCQPNKFEVEVVGKMKRVFLP